MFRRYAFIGMLLWSASSTHAIEIKSSILLKYSICSDWGGCKNIAVVSMDDTVSGRRLFELISPQFAESDSSLLAEESVNTKRCSISDSLALELVEVWARALKCAEQDSSAFFRFDGVTIKAFAAPTIMKEWDEYGNWHSKVIDKLARTLIAYLDAEASKKDSYNRKLSRQVNSFARKLSSRVDKQTNVQSD